MWKGENSRGGRSTHIKRMGMLVISFGVKNGVLASFKVLSVKKSTAGALAISLRVLNQKILQ